MSLAYLLSILLLYSCFYTFHIPYSFYNLLFSCSITSSFIYFCTFIYFLYFSCVHLSCLIISHILFISSCTLLLILVPVYYHQCYASHIMSCILAYTCHFLLCFMSANTLEANIGNNCLYPTVLYIPEGIIIVRDSDLCPVILYPKVPSLYEIVTYAL